MKGVIETLDKWASLVVTIGKLNNDATVKGCGTSKRVAKELFNVLYKHCKDYADKRQIDTKQLFDNLQRNP